MKVIQNKSVNAYGETCHTIAFKHNKHLEEVVQIETTKLVDVKDLVAHENSEFILIRVFKDKCVVWKSTAIRLDILTALLSKLEEI